ncbi:MAG: hypothetical protein J5J06_06750 [Phycisphaerae bacterium]|nr:hypothetical protein [Phycisphaerae bacterium]
MIQPTERRTGDGVPHRQTLLIVEPDRLTRWSVQQYLNDCFDILEADCAVTAHTLLDTAIVDALVVADDLPEHAADDVEQHARRCNPGIKTVRIVTDTVDDEGPRLPNITRRLEKPFKLSALADSLGVPERVRAARNPR